ncbi:3-hydroxyacyl-CoA dehydrogenase NAD-binding domain-containing protein [Aquibaculum sediminis]|uniref:3-hydroxyacyl-CoA dehydrogenase NAD-binding domain-containing protein n=1 Tax=Aquibaculum sediminis TaxID=3231907 RepID=UPI003455B84E
MQDPKNISRVACVGTGVIGGGWTAHFLARGYDVLAWDPGAQAEAALKRLIETAWPALESLGLAEGASPDRLRFTSSLQEAVSDVAFVQESGPERLDLKRKLLADLAAATGEETVIASSTSGYSMTDMAAEAEDASRLVVGHPFNPPYLIPLVEVVGGKRTAGWTVDQACAFYEVASKSVIRMERELPGFIGNRLQDAIWREALHMVAEGEATVEQIDQAIVDGPGLRWALMGPCLTFHLAGGEGGMAHMLDHFGPALKEPWTRLEAPDLTRELRDAMVEGCEREAGERNIADLVRERDRGLIAILKALRESNTGGARR